MSLNHGVSIHIITTGSAIGNYVIRLHGNAIIKHDNGVISVCNGNHKLTKATKDTLTKCLGGCFNKNTYLINSLMIELSSEWQNINEGA